MAKEYRLHYHVSNGGDGSANVHFHTTENEAEKADENQSEGWGESSVGSILLKEENGKIFRDVRGYIDDQGNLVDSTVDNFDWKKYKFGSAWVEVSASK